MASNLVVPLRVFSGNLSTTTTAADRGWLFNIDTTKFDGTVSYKLCGVGRIANGAESGTVDMQPAGGGTSLGTLTWTGDTNNKRLETTITPTAGDTAYTIFAGVTGGVQFVVTAVWIEVTLVGATKLQTDIPLSTLGGNVSGGPTALVQARPFLYTAANWTNATFQLVTVGNRGASGTLTLDLFDGTSVVGSTVHNVNAPGDRQVSSAMTLTDGAEHVLRATASTGTDVLTSACIRVTISTIDKLEVHYQVGGTRATHAVDWTNAVATTTVHCVGHRAIVSTAGFTGGILTGAYLEGVGSSPDSGDVIDLRKDGTNDTGTAGTSVGSVTITSASKQRIRSSDLLSGWANERYYAGLTKASGSGTATGNFAAVIFTVVVPGGATSSAVLRMLL